jgi:hypothetical protein
MRAGAVWEKSNFLAHSDAIEVRQAGPLPRFVLAAHRTAGGGLLQLVDREQSRVLHEQKLGLLSNGNQWEFCPKATAKSSWDGARAHGYLDALNLAVGNPAPMAPPRNFEIADGRISEPCEIGTGPVSDEPAARMWDGRAVILDNGFEKLTGRCSARYATLVSVQRTRAGDYSPMVGFYDRATLRALRVFGQLQCHPDNHSCGELEARDILAVRVEQGQVTVETSGGEFAAR